MCTMPELLLMLHAAATVYMTGVIWYVQIVHYPLFAAAGASAFADYVRKNAARTAWVVGPPMLTEMASALLMFWIRPPGIATWSLSLGLSLLVVIWLSTAALQVPCHHALQKGFDAATHRRLVLTNWIRTAAWSFRGALAIWMVAARP